MAEEQTVELREFVEDLKSRLPKKLRDKMPVMDGWQFLAIQKANPELASIPVIVCSGQRYEEDVPVPPERFLRKPFLPAHLLARIELVFSFESGSQGEQATFPPR